MTEHPGPRFLTLQQVAEELAASTSVIRGLIRTGDLPAIQIGGRGQWRIERTMLEQFITGAYEASVISASEDDEPAAEGHTEERRNA